ncbi:MAG: hypothetical protein IKU13_10065, partial [Clostridia bacterium]|nr:hypothetical protein [Clostridia bacterium]
MASILRKLNKLPLLIFMITGSAVLAILAYNIELITGEAIRSTLIASGVIALLGLCFIRKT